MKAAEAQRRAPADPGIARSAFQGGRTPAQQRHPLLLEKGYVPEGFANNRAQAQIMVGAHQVLPSPSFLAAYGTDDDRVERLGTAIGCCLDHAGRLPNHRGNCQFKINDPLRRYIYKTLPQPLGKDVEAFTLCRSTFILNI